MGRQVVPNYRTVLHHESNSLQLGNVGDRISSDANEISKFPRLNRADAILPTQHFRGVTRYRANHIETLSRRRAKKGTPTRSPGRESFPERTNTCRIRRQISLRISARAEPGCCIAAGFFRRNQSAPIEKPET